ncbi:WGR domain-containing protein [Xinfangfangia sp. D13-10-4-6]|uniref:WGR domain-containing protein n=1 Tax=Pseudogemmobacter hezensis TaxID=2737662 RepID=UPI001552FB56|nr:WGR domain-containing protein [Pseudogemmobacter hezensis]NPD15064.1 WGR domain-containing protein [Pseudogemmobacter hezensis]
MQKNHSTAHLRRIDAERNMRRFYAASIQPTLFGEVSVVRNWGRIGTAGRMQLETFHEPVQAEEAFLKLVRFKQRRGYESRAEEPISDQT